jgi:hypothetical protein
MNIINQQIDTLKLHYYSIDEQSSSYIETYNNFVDKLKDNKLEAMEIKNNSNELRFVKTTLQDINYIDYEFKVMASTIKSFQVNLINADISVAFKKITKISSNPIIRVEFRSEYLTRYGYVFCIKQVNNIIKKILPTYTIKVSEIHLATDIQGYNFNNLDKDRFAYRSRLSEDMDEQNSIQKIFGTGLKKTGFTFGKGDFMLRVYNKTTQLRTIKKSGYVIPLRWEQHKNYDEHKDVWRVEFQLRRNYLKTLIGSNGILDGFEKVLNDIPNIWGHCVKRFVHYNLNDKQCIDVYRGYYINKKNQSKVLTYDNLKKRRLRAGISKVWQLISLFNNTEPNIDLTKFIEIKKPEVEYTVNAFKGVISTFIKLNKGNFNKEDLALVLCQAEELNIEKTGLSILDSCRLKSLDYINVQKKYYTKYGSISDGYKDFKKDLFQNISDVFLSLEDKEYQQNLLKQLGKKGFTLDDIKYPF